MKIKFTLVGMFTLGALYMGLPYPWNLPALAIYAIVLMFTDFDQDRRAHRSLREQLESWKCQHCQPATSLALKVSEEHYRGE